MDNPENSDPRTETIRGKKETEAGGWMWKRFVRRCVLLTLAEVRRDNFCYPSVHLSYPILQVYVDHDVEFLEKICMEK